MWVRLASGLTRDSIVDGDGLRTVIWTQGCRHNCEGCHNKKAQSFSGGLLVRVEDIKKEIDKLKIQRGITFSGGEPFEQSKACSDIAKYAKSRGYDIWAYTGYLIEDLIKDKEKFNFLKQVDILVDGPFILEKRDLTLKFRGSSNQRIVDVVKTLEEGKVVEKNYDSMLIFNDVI